MENKDLRGIEKRYGFTNELIAIRDCKESLRAGYTINGDVARELERRGISTIPKG